MLVLNRQPGEAIVIGDGIRIVVLSSDRRGVRLGIEAPSTMLILREELVREVASENDRASNPDAAQPWAAKLQPRQRRGDSHD